VIRPPSPHTLLAPSHKHSVLLGLHTSSSSSSTNTHTSSVAAGGSGENNLAFKCTRKRFVIETLHLDAEGGVSERRTSAPQSAAMGLSATPESGHAHHHEDHHGHLGSSGDLDRGSHLAHVGRSTQVALSRVPVEVANASGPASALSSPAIIPEQTQNRKKEKKRVAFQSDRPDLYDF